MFLYSIWRRVPSCKWREGTDDDYGDYARGFGGSNWIQTKALSLF